MQEENQKLVQYVAQLIKNQVSKEQIKNQLSAVGWSENDIKVAYGKALINMGVPVPSETMQTTFEKKSSTMEIVLNLFSFVLLGIIAIALGTLFFQIINRYFPDSLKVHGGKILTDSIHYAIAALVVGFPIYFLIIYFWFRGFEKDKRKVESKLIKWVTYLVLFVVAGVVIGDLIAVVYTFLQGELSIRFFLKFLTIFVIASTIFGFYFLERRKIQYHKSIPHNIFKILAISVSSVIVVGIIVGFIASGSPTKARKREFDWQRIRDLDRLTTCVKSYANEYQRLPNSLDELQGSASHLYCVNKKDPETKKVYEYRVVSNSIIKGLVQEGIFELCANFSLKSEDEEDQNVVEQYPNRWKNHPAGRSCQKITVKIVKIKK